LDKTITVQGYKILFSGMVNGEVMEIEVRITKNEGRGV
jgi:hypothetical protein